MVKNEYTRYPGGQSRGGVLTKSTHAISLANAHPDLPLAAFHTGPPVSGYSTPKSHPICSPPPENGRATQPQTDRQPTRNARTKPRLMPRTTEEAGRSFPLFIGTQFLESSLSSSPPSPSLIMSFGEELAVGACFSDTKSLQVGIGLHFAKFCLLIVFRERERKIPPELHEKRRGCDAGVRHRGCDSIGSRIRSRN